MKKHPMNKGTRGNFPNPDIDTACLLFLIILTLVFIFSNSVPDKEASAIQSGLVKKIIEPILELVVGEGNVTDHLVRKLAHFTEFGLLGVELALLVKKWTSVPLFFSLLVAMTDETIQIFTGRGPQVQDVWLDFAGACCGFFVGMCMFFVWKSWKRGREFRHGNKKQRWTQKSEKRKLTE